MQTIKEEFPEFSSLKQVIISPSFQTPMQIGLFQPIILLPGLEYTKKDLYYILKHEMTHYYNRDTWIKLGINLWRCLFWWFPLTYLLYYELDESLELKCDYIVTKDMTASQKSAYLTALLHVYERQTIQKQSNKIFSDKATALYKDQDALLYRFQYITVVKKKHNISIPIYVAFLSLFFASYLFILQANGEPILENDGSIYFSQDNAYISYNEKGEYELYIDNELTTVLDNTTANKLIDAGITYNKTQMR